MAVRSYADRVTIQSRHFETCSICPATHIHRALNYYEATKFISESEAKQFLMTLRNHIAYKHFRRTYRGPGDTATEYVRY